MLNGFYEKNPDIVSRRIADEVILVPIRRSVGDVDCLYALNEVAARVWELLDGQRSLKAVCEALVSEFDVSQTEAEEDLFTLIEQFREIGAIRVLQAARG